MKAPKTVLLIFITFCVYSLTLKAQDTVFYQKHIFDTPVRNVLAIEGNVYVKTGDGLYQEKEGNWSMISDEFEERFLFFEDDFFESEFIPDQYTFDPEIMSHLIPQESLSNPTFVRLANRLFISVGGSLYEYSIYTHYQRSYTKASIRDVYFDDSLKVISSYSGIYINDSLQVEEPGYSNGHLTNLNGQYLLCVDGLYLLRPSYAFENITKSITDELGHFRKLISYQGNVFAQMNISIARLDSTQGWTSIHGGKRYTDIEKSGGSLYFTSDSGELFSYNGVIVEQLLQLETSINDVYTRNDQIFLGTDKGLYKYLTESNKSELLLNINDLVGVRFDPNNNLWLATENGLYLSEDGNSDPIPYISGIECNRGAMTLFQDRLYVGSTTGLYEIDFQNVIRDFIPKQSKRNIQLNPSSKTLLWFLIPSIATILLILFVYLKKYWFKFYSREKDEGVFSLDAVKKLILEKGILSVDELAEHLETNTVQLNRMFKTHDITPGKYLKQVKLEWANEMLSRNIPMHEVVKKVGYSANFIKKNTPLASK